MDSQDIENFKNIVYVQSMVACASIELAAMQTENKRMELLGFAPTYTEKNFQDLILQYGIHHNAVVERMINR